MIHKCAFHVNIIRVQGIESAIDEQHFITNIKSVNTLVLKFWEEFHHYSIVANILTVRNLIESSNLFSLFIQRITNLKAKKGCITFLINKIQFWNSNRIYSHPKISFNLTNYFKLTQITNKIFEEKWKKQKN